MNNIDIKQVIVIVKSLNMRKGKMIAQGAHASLDAFLKIQNTDIAKQWQRDGGKKIVLSVDTETELFDIQTQCINARINCALIVDEGRTEFHGNPTITCLGIGPVESEKIDLITKNDKLKLL